MAKKAPVISFFVLAYLLSWLFWLPLLFIRESQELFILFLIVGGQGPFVAAIIVSKWVGTFKAFTRLLLMWRVHIRWYLAALALPVLIAIVGYGVFVSLGGTPAPAQEILPLYFYPLVLLFVMILGGGLEEPGWRGFALPVLLKQYSPFSASIIIGVVWAVWHLPLFFAPLSSQYGLPFGWYFLNTLALSVIFTWLFLQSQGSTVIAIILHGNVNAVLNWYPGLSDIPTAWGTLPFFAPITIASWLLAGLLLFEYRRQFFAPAQ